MGVAVEELDERTLAQVAAMTGKRGPNWRRNVASFAVAGVAALALVSGLLLTPRFIHHDTVVKPVAVPSSTARATDHSPAQLARTIDKTKDQLAASPGDWIGWAGLGEDYLEQARITADPTGYGRAQAALDHSMQVHPDGNVAALTALSSLAAARRDFTGALHYGQAAVAADGYNTEAQGMMADALGQLGRYYESWTAIQQMVDLRPDTGGYSREALSWVVRGDMTQARSLMSRALALAPDPATAAATLLQLAELAWQAGDLATARSFVDDGLRRAPGNAQLIAERAKLAADAGDTKEAVADYQDAMARLPMPQYALEYGDLLATTGDKAGAATQYALSKSLTQRFATQGVNVDLEVANFQAEHGAPAAAVVAAKSGYQKQPSIEAADSLGWALHKAKQDAQALPYARKALAMGTHNALFQFHVGMIEAALGQRATARTDIAAALHTNPYFSLVLVPLARAALAALRDAP